MLGFREHGAGVGGKNGVEWEAGVAVEHGRGGVGGGQVRQAGGQGRSIRVRRWGSEGSSDVTGIGAEVENSGEMAVDVLVEQISKGKMGEGKD